MTMASFTETKSSGAPLPPNVHISSHPLVQSKLSSLRRANGPGADSTHEVKVLVDSIGSVVATEALAGTLSVVSAGEVSF